MSKYLSLLSDEKEHVRLKEMLLVKPSQFSAKRQMRASFRSRARTASFKPRERPSWIAPCLRTSWTAVSTVRDPGAAATGAGAAGASVSDISEISSYLLDNRNRTQKWDESPC